MELSIFWKLRHCSLALFVLLFAAACSDDSGEVQSADQQMFNSVGESTSISASIYQGYVANIRKGLLAQPYTGAALHPNAFFQSDAPFELWLAMAILTDSNGETYALQQQITRLQIKPVSTEINSAWDFSNVLALNYRLENLQEVPSMRAESVALAQREAIDLAGASEGEQKVWVGAFELDEEKLAKDCHSNYTLNSPKLVVEFQQTYCSDTQGGDSFGFSSGVAMPVNGAYTLNGQDIELQGFGWIMHAWGVPPDSSAAAVIVDRAWLLLDNSLDVQLQRTRRRSGSGKSRSAGTFSVLNINESQNSPVNTELQAKLQAPEFTTVFDDESETKHLPNSFELATSSAGIKVQLIPPTTSTGLPVFGNEWFSAVSVEGSHQGGGFISYTLPVME